MSEKSQSMFTEAIAAAQAGDRSTARELLTRLLRIEPSNAEYWLWLSAVVPTERERLYCLKSALKHDPTNRAALRGLLILGARKPEQAELNAAIGIPKRARKAVSPSRSRSQQLPMKWILAGAGVFTVIGLGFMATLFFSRPRGAAPTLPPIDHTQTQMAIAPTATNTPIPADQRVNRTPIPSELAATPLVYFLENTPTPTPFTGLTPAPQYEAFQASLRALDRTEYQEALDLIDQVLALDPEFAGAHYVRGEILRLSGNPREAIAAYDRAIGFQPDYPAAYLGSARAQAMTDPPVIPSAFERAIELDPQMVDAYIYSALYHSERRHFKKAEEILLSALEEGVSSPELLINLSEAEYLLGKYESALKHAVEGSANDPGSLKGYLVLGRSYTVLGYYHNAISPLQTFLAYEPEDHRAWAALGESYLNTGSPDLALQAFNTSLGFRDYAPAYQGRGDYQYQQGDFQAALNDYFKARQFGPNSPLLTLSIGKSYFHLGNLQEAINEINSMLASTEDQSLRAEGYAYLGLIFESTDPPFLPDAIANWTYVLGIEESSPELRAMAEEHLQNLQGDDFTSPTPRPVVTSAATPVPAVSSPSPTNTATITPTPEPTAVLPPTATPTPRGLVP